MKGLDFRFVVAEGIFAISGVMLSCGEILQRVQVKSEIVKLKRS